jgi:hypothetical protein
MDWLAWFACPLMPTAETPMTFIHATTKQIPTAILDIRALAKIGIALMTVPLLAISHVSLGHARRTHTSNILPPPLFVESCSTWPLPLS